MIAIVHHWDSDGICSAGIYAMHLEEVDESWVNLSPEPGIFEFDSRIIEISQKAEKTVIIDLNMPDGVRVMNGMVLFLDHHLQSGIEGVEYVNPAVTEKRSVPSASWVVSEYTGIWNHLTAIGAVGDNGLRVFNTEYGNKLVDLLKRENIDENSALMISRLLDTPSIMGMRKEVEEMVLKVIQSTPEEILNDPELNRNLERIESEIDMILDTIGSENTSYFEFESDYNIISMIGRKMVWEMGNRAVLLVNKNFRGMAQVYFRISPEMTGKIPIVDIIQRMRSMGLNSGGKREVLGCICSRKDVEMALDIIRSNTGGLFEY